ncbi:MAG TPA: FtsX-like permease family protein, partial [Gemmatimonadales bacterium]
PGFRRDGVLLVQMDFSPLGLKGHRLVTEPAEVLRRIRALPSVISASMAMLTPIGGMGWNDFVIAPGFRPTSRHDSLAYFNHVSDGYFETMGTALTAGRDLNPDDVAQARSVALVNETMARRLFGPGSPIGRTFRTPVGDSMSPQREVIGVVQDAKYQRLDEKPLATGYFPYGVGEPAGARVSFQMRVLSAAPVVSGVKGIAASLSPDISLEFTTLSAQVSESLARPRVLAVLSGFFGALALLLAVIGLYGTMAYSVTQRRNEIGIRMALGAGNWRMVRMVVSEAGILVAAGIVGGTALALASTRVLASFLYGVTPTDPATLGISVVVLATIAMAATAAPAWRAARLDPMTALRED